MLSTNKLSSVLLPCLDKVVGRVFKNFGFSFFRFCFRNFFCIFFLIIIQFDIFPSKYLPWLAVTLVYLPSIIPTSTFPVATAYFLCSIFSLLAHPFLAQATRG